MKESEVSWRVYYTENAERDLQGIFDYISDILQEPVTAANQTNRIMDATDALDHMPFRYRLYDKDPWRGRGLRVLPIDRYLIFYYPIKARGAVAVIRIMYGGRDTRKQLEGTVYNSTFARS